MSAIGPNRAYDAVLGTVRAKPGDELESEAPARE